MKAIAINLTAATILLTTGIFLNSFKNYSERLNHSLESVEILISESPDHSMMVEAVRYEDEIIPSVDLPELTIEATYNPSTMVKAKRINGEVIPVVDLPELIIEG